MVVRLEHSHSFIDSLDNHFPASGPAWCRHCRPPGNAVSGQSSTMCIVAWWISPPLKTYNDITTTIVVFGSEHREYSNTINFRLFEYISVSSRH